MAGASETLHEDAAKLKPETVDRHRAFVSLQEELEAVDWYNQRVDAAGDPELREILAHNRDEEKEHASMVLEWLRRHDGVLDQHLRRYLFTDKPILAIEEAADEAGNAAPQAETREGSLGIGSLRGTGSLNVAGN
ncbi:MAG TPA: ferritin-like domain-containing protein [Alphaproteobacteria bacterium]|nr:ferritin-like domain-containing protein [Alphaproteobacteria bacterium]